MNGTKMSKSFFFQMIEKRLEQLTEEVKTMKADAELPFEQRLAKENILFGKVLELNTINFFARDVDYFKYIELEEKINALRDKI